MMTLTPVKPARVDDVLPTRVVAYFLLAMMQFFQSGYREV